MDSIKSQFDRIQQQLAGLTPSQKMLSAALVAIMVMTVLWWGKFAATPEYEPLLTQGLSPEELTQISSQLKSKGVDHRIEGNQILVARDNMVDALAHVSWAEAMPKNTASGFDEMIKQLTAWDGTSRQNAMFNHGKELTLQRIISRFPGVASATVLIDPSENFRIGRELHSTASVDVAMQDPTSTPPKRLAAACAQLVAGSQSGLKPSAVTVVINGRPVPVPNADNGAFVESDALERKQAAELHYKTKLEEHLAIPGVRVTVNVHVNSVTETSESTKYDKANTLSLEKRIQSKIKEETNAVPPGGEGGVGPNTIMSIEQPNRAISAQNAKSDVEETVEFDNLASVEKKNLVKPAGDATVTSASVRVPRSYLVAVAKEHHPNAVDPDGAVLKKVIDDELLKIRDWAIAGTGIENKAAIAVDVFTDLKPAPRDLEIAHASGVTTMLGGHMKEIALGGLALASLFMMSMIVRKGNAVVAPVISPMVAAGPRVLSSHEDFAGEAAGHSPTLDGMELDDDSIKTQQMLSQVTSLVGESPDTAAQLIKRWMNQR